MSRRIVPVIYDIVSKELRDSNGAILPRSKYPFITEQESAVVNLTIVIDSDLTAYPGLTTEMSFLATLDRDFNTPNLMCQTTNTGFNLADDFAGGIADLTKGQLSLRLSANTPAFIGKMSNKREVSNTILQITAVETLDENQEMTLALDFPFRALGLQTNANLNTTTPVSNVILESFLDPAGSGATFVRMVTADGVVVEVFKPAGT